MNEQGKKYLTDNWQLNVLREDSSSDLSWKLLILKKKDMNTVELKHMINEKISLIEDESFLVAIKTIVDSKVSSTIYKLSDFQKERISIGQEQLKNGQAISNDDLQSEIDQWLSTK